MKKICKKNLENMSKIGQDMSNNKINNKTINNVKNQDNKEQDTLMNKEEKENDDRTV